MVTVKGLKIVMPKSSVTASEASYRGLVCATVTEFTTDGSSVVAMEFFSGSGAIRAGRKFLEGFPSGELTWDWCSATADDVRRAAEFNPSFFEGML